MMGRDSGFFPGGFLVFGGMALYGPPNNRGDVGVGPVSDTAFLNIDSGGEPTGKYLALTTRKSLTGTRYSLGMMIPVWDDQLTVCAPFRSASSTTPEMLYGLDTPGMITHLNLASTDGKEKPIGQRKAVPLMDGKKTFSPFLWETSGCEPFSIALASDVVVATLGKTPKEYNGSPTEWWLSIRSRDDGKELWRKDLPSAPLVGGLALDRDGTILCPMADGSIIAFGDTHPAAK